MHKMITEDDFYRLYKPVKNPFVKNGPWDGCMLETYGLELAHVREVMAENPNKVWTVLDCDGALILSSGYHHVNRMGYLITEVPVDEGVDITVEDEDDFPTDEDDEDA